MKLNKVEPKYISKSNPRIGLITLGSDFRIEKDFNTNCDVRELFNNNESVLTSALAITKEAISDLSNSFSVKVTEIKSRILPELNDAYFNEVFPGEDAPKNELAFSISHRFGNINGGINDFYGLDESTIRFGFEYGLSDRIDLGIGRSNYEDIVDGFIKVKTK